EILAQHWQRACRARLLQIFVAALEEIDVGQHRKAGRAIRFVVTRNRCRIEVVTDHARAGRGFLDLGNHRRCAYIDLRFQGRGESARIGQIGATRRQFAQRQRRAARFDFPRLAREDALQDVAHGACVAATNSSSFLRAAPDAMASRARSMPSSIEAATSHAYNAAPAFNSTISRATQVSFLSARSSIAFDSSAFVTRRLRLDAIANPNCSGSTSYSRTVPSRNSPISVAPPNEISSSPS